jgi:hypothetical protein
LYRLADKFILKGIKIVHCNITCDPN